MKRLIVLSGITMVISTMCYGQQNKDYRLTDHYFGIQGNEMFREIFSFGGDRAAINNPYTFTYNANSKATGAGFNLGFGYFSAKTSLSDAGVDRETIIKDLSLRLGYEKKFEVAKKLIASTGIDFLIFSGKSKTSTGFNSSESKTSGWGLGPRATLSYAIIPRVLVMTEATYYFRKLKTESTFDDTFTLDNTVKSESFNLEVPLVLYFVFKI